MAGSGYQNIITTDLVEDLLLTDSNIKTFKKAYKEMYEFAMVRPKHFSACIPCQVACHNFSLYAEFDRPLPEKIRKTESGCEWASRTCCPGKACLRREDEELLSAAGARHAEARKDSRNMAPEERHAEPRKSQIRAPKITRGTEESARGTEESARGAAQRSKESAPR
jgi:hypothetical protein